MEQRLGTLPEPRDDAVARLERLFAAADAMVGVDSRMAEALC